MKKQNLKSLKFNKVSISNFNPTEVKGGASGVKYSCPYCETRDAVVCEDRAKY